MALGFIKNLIGVKADKLVNDGVQLLVSWDPKSATDAELRTMEHHLDELGLRVAAARQSMTKEQQEYDAIVALQHQRMKAAELLEGQLAAESDPAKRAGLEKSLETLIQMLEAMQPDVDREKHENEEAHSFLEQLEQAYAEAGAKLKAARSQLEQAQRDMERAENQRRMAEERAEQARQAAGLAQATSGLNTALKAMQDKAQANLLAADAASHKSALLKPSQPEAEDQNIAAALAAASGHAPQPTSLADRLAKLRSGQS